MAGLAAAISALEKIDRVILLEKGHRTGGSMYLSGGTIWTLNTTDKAQKVAPRGDRDRQSIVVDSLEDDLDWLEGLGIDIEPILQESEERWGGQFDPKKTTATLTAVIEERGGNVYRNTPMESVHTDERGLVDEVTAAPKADECLQIATKAVVFATGGFQGNTALVEQHITESTDNMWLRSNPWSTGDGYLESLALGARVTSGMDSFYGHNMAAPPAQFTVDDFVDVTQYYGPKAIALDSNGRRFTDESAHWGEEGVAVATAKDASGRAYYVLDNELFASYHTPERRVGAMIDHVSEHGGRTATAPTLSKLAAQVSDWKIDGDAMVSTVHAFNRAMRADNDQSLAIPRETHRRPIEEPPLHVVEVQPGITFTTGGVDVDEDMRVIRRSRSSSNMSNSVFDEGDLTTAPLPGLYAAGVDVGGIHSGGYIGGLATGLTTGRLAGGKAAEFAIERSNSID